MTIEDNNAEAAKDIAALGEDWDSKRGYIGLHDGLEPTPVRRVRDPAVLQAYGATLRAYYELLGEPPLESLAARTKNSLWPAGRAWIEPDRLAAALAGERYLDHDEMSSFFSLGETIVRDRPWPPGLPYTVKRAPDRDREERLQECAWDLWHLENWAAERTSSAPREIIEATAAVGSGAGLAVTAKYMADVIKTALTEIGQTKRERLRQDGETERARLGQASTPNQPEQEAEPLPDPEPEP